MDQTDCRARATRDDRARAHTHAYGSAQFYARTLLELAAQRYNYETLRLRRRFLLLRAVCELWEILCWLRYVRARQRFLGYMEEELTYLYDIPVWVVDNCSGNRAENGLITMIDIVRRLEHRVPVRAVLAYFILQYVSI